MLASTAEIVPDVAEAEATATRAKPRRVRSKTARTVAISDARTVAYREYCESQELERAVVADLGGYDALTAGQLIVVRGTIDLEMRRRRRQARWWDGEDNSDTEQSTLVNSITRTLRDVGAFQRTARDVTPADPVSDWISDRLAAKRAGAGESAGDGAAEATGNGEATDGAPGEFEGHFESTGCQVPVPTAGAAPQEADAHAADCVSAPASSSDEVEHG